MWLLFYLFIIYCNPFLSPFSFFNIRRYRDKVVFYPKAGKEKVIERKTHHDIETFIADELITLHDQFIQSN